MQGDSEIDDVLRLSAVAGEMLGDSPSSPALEVWTAKLDTIGGRNLAEERPIPNHRPAAVPQLCPIRRMRP